MNCFHLATPGKFKGMKFEEFELNGMSLVFACSEDILLMLERKHFSTVSENCCGRGRTEIPTILPFVQ
jgi:hypothetical protein